MAKNSRRQRVGSADALSVIVNRLLAIFNNPITCISAIFAIYATISVIHSSTDNIWTEIAAQLNKTAAFKPIANWITSHQVRLTGFIDYTVPLSVVRRYAGAYWIFSYFVCFMLKEATVIEYAIQAVLFYLFVTVRAKQAKLLMLVVFVVLYYTNVGFTNILGKSK